MATPDQIKTLVKAHFAGQEALFWVVARQITEDCLVRGQLEFARDLKALIPEHYAVKKPEETYDEKHDRCPLT